MACALANGALCFSTPKHNGKSSTAQTVQIKPVLNFYYSSWKLYTPWEFMKLLFLTATLSFFISLVLAPIASTHKDYKIGISCFSAKHAALIKRKSKDWLTRNQDIVSEWDHMSIHRLLFQWASTIKIQLRVLVWYKADLIIISLKINLL
jgi:hypothetical protein